MSDDLISRKSLIESLSVDYYEHYSKNHSSSENDLFNLIVELIENYPTAYDVEKVIGQLEELREMVPVNRLLDDIIKDKPKELGQLISYRKAIEIVKSGSVADE